MNIDTSHIWHDCELESNAKLVLSRILYRRVGGGHLGWTDSGNLLGMDGGRGRVGLKVMGKRFLNWHIMT